MAKRIKRNKPAPKPAKREWTKCRHSGCKKDSVMMRRSRTKKNEMEHYCAGHWKSDVEAKDPKAYRDKPKPRPKPAAKKRVVKKAKSDPVAVLKKRRVVKR